LIPAANITAWRNRAPWPDDQQVEQDLVLSRLIVEIANHDLLGPELAFRGGTCLHKLLMPEPARYSEDLDYVRRTKSGIGSYLDALTEIAGAVGLRRVKSETGRAIANVVYEAEATHGPGVFRVKVELNIAETEAHLPREERPYRVDSPWWQGSATVPTFALEELLGTKLRALYQRRKGRDLFDLWLALTELEVDDEAVVSSYRHYIGDDEFSFPQLARNLEGKLGSRDFTDDLLQLVVDLPGGYDPRAAADIVMARLGSRLRNAPPPGEIGGGGWLLGGC
jgi:predicted nucleotidyltransferase component of viral defense system